MISYLQLSVLLCPFFVSAFGHLNSSERMSVSTLEPLEESSFSQMEGRQFSNDDKTYEKLYPLSYFRSTGKRGLPLGPRRTKTRREEHSMSMPDFEEELPVIEKPLLYNYDYKYRPADPGPGYYYGQPYGYHMNDLQTEGKEILKGFGVGLAVGLGLLGLLSGLLKLFLGPLAFGSLLSLLLVLAAPVPVITTGKMLLSTLPKYSHFGKPDLQEILNEIMRKLPDLKATSQ